MSLSADDVKPAYYGDDPEAKPAFYMVGGWTFDEDDRDLAYIDAAINAWRAWREWVEENGEHNGH